MRGLRVKDCIIYIIGCNFKILLYDMLLPQTMVGGAHGKEQKCIFILMMVKGLIRTYPSPVLYLR